MSDPTSLLNSEESRRQAVKLGLALTENTPLAPNVYECMLLEQFIQGKLTIDQVVNLVESGKQE